MKDSLQNLLEQLSGLTRLTPESREWIRQFIVYNYYIILTALFIMLVAALFLSRKSLFDMVKNCRKKSLYIISGIAALSLGFKLIFLDLHPQVFFDEVLFVQTAISYSRYGVHLLWNVMEYPRNFMICTAGWPYLISLAFRIFGNHRPETAYLLSAVMSSLTVFFVFFTVKLFSESEEAGLWSGAVFAVYPVFNRLSTSSAMGTSSIFFIFFTLMIMLLYFREKKTPLLYLAFISFSFTLNIRQESFLVVLPLLLIFFLLFHPDIREELRKPHIYINSAILALFVFPAATISYYGISTGYYFFFESAELMRDHILSNLHRNIAYWIENQIQPLSVTILSLAGLYAVYRENRKAAYYIVGSFLFMQWFYSINPSCEFSCTRTLDSWRSAANLLVPAVILSGIGFTLITGYFREYHPKARLPVLLLLLTVILMIPLRFYPFEKQKTVWANEYLFLKQNTAVMEPSAVIVVDKGINLNITSFLASNGFSSRVPLEYFSLTDPKRARSARPLIRFVHRMIGIEKRPVYLYLSSVSALNFSDRMDFYRKIFRMRPVAGYSYNEYFVGFVLYRIEGFEEDGEQLRRSLEGITPPEVEAGNERSVEK